MTIGPFAFPVTPLVFALAVAVALLVGRLAHRIPGVTSRAVTLTVAAGLLAARLAFVVRYLPQYQHSVVSMVDFRDLGFDALAGLVGGAGMAAWLFYRHRDLRVALGMALSAGLVTWGAANAVAHSGASRETLPAVMLADESGGARLLSPDGGRPTIVNLWASWCGPCRSELPALATAQRDHPEVRIVFVDEGETPAAVRDYLAAQHIALSNLMLDPRQVMMKQAGTAGLPTTLFYDAAGGLLARHLGPFSAATFQDALKRYYPGLSRK
ncbi:TlpA family protein disulfide reductase [Paraburkholderia kururiensis]|uniref:TlpA family protein disulfide reductase n=1 Tax=Paraburkholderia kururiensis TaxID=984307 RepID=UPI0018F5E79B|nr:TlpA disulfide reductase family protein [Paraburkholderia kururiensis]